MALHGMPDVINSYNHSTITIQDALLEGERMLVPLHESARIDAEILLAHGINQTRAYLHAWPERTLTAEQLDCYTSLVRRRANGEPVAYLTGSREFWSLPLNVTDATLVPRPETELLVEQALLRIPPDSNKRIADLGTGCGAIALAIASERPASCVVATDIDTRVLDVANLNAESLNIGNVEFRRGDWFEPLAGERFNIIVSNPPYIREEDPHITQGDLRFEPDNALVAGKEGLEAITHIISQAKKHLLDQGWLMVEHGHEQQAHVLELFAHEGYLRVGGITDIAGHGRAVIGQYLSK